MDIERAEDIATDALRALYRGKGRRPFLQLIKAAGFADNADPCIPLWDGMRWVMTRSFIGKSLIPTDGTCATPTCKSYPRVNKDGERSPFCSRCRANRGATTSSYAKEGMVSAKAAIWIGLVLDKLSKMQTMREQVIYLAHSIVEMQRRCEEVRSDGAKKTAQERIFRWVRDMAERCGLTDKDIDLNEVSDGKAPWSCISGAHFKLVDAKLIAKYLKEWDCEVSLVERSMPKYTPLLRFRPNWYKL